MRLGRGKMLHDSSSVREGSEGETLAAAANQALRDVPGSCCYGNDWLGPCQDKPKFLHLRTHPLTRQHNTQSCMGNAGRDLNSCEQIVHCIHYRPLNLTGTRQHFFSNYIQFACVVVMLDIYIHTCIYVLTWNIPLGVHITMHVLYIAVCLIYSIPSIYLSINCCHWCRYHLCHHQNFQLMFVSNLRRRIGCTFIVS